MTLHAVAQACGGILTGPVPDEKRELTAITTDSRKVTCGCLFVAIPGNRVDGHDFIDDVISRGAYAVLGERDPGETDFPYIRVDSSLRAVREIAQYYLSQLGIPVIGITGSVGKTSTKEMIASVLSQKYRVLRTEGNFNNALGLPLTIFRLREEDEIAVLEMGISDFGEMHTLASIARPDTCVITNIGTCHLEQLGDRDGVLRAKSEIFDFLRPDGHIVLNGDDDKLRLVSRGEDTVYFGFDSANDIRADEVVECGLEGSRCRILTPAEDFSAHVPLPGRHMISNALAAAAVGLIYGLTTEEIRLGIERYETISGRFRIVRGREYTVIDDCYNANPMSVKASLGVLRTAGGRKVALLGDMGELGKDEAALHASVGEAAAGLELDAVYCAGTLCAHLIDAIKRAGSETDARLYPSTEALEAALPELICPGDTILVKASHFMGFDRIVRTLTESST